jgi:hypothetical protein
MELLDLGNVAWRSWESVLSFIGVLHMPRIHVFWESGVNPFRHRKSVTLLTSGDWNVPI